MPKDVLSMEMERTIWRYAQADFARACSLIDATDWDSLLTGDVNESLANWEAKYMEIIELCIPKKSLPKRRNLPWLTKDLNRAIRKRKLMSSIGVQGVMATAYFSINTKNKGTKL